jgi:hypothetical protein
MDIITFISVVIGGGYLITLAMMSWSEWYYGQELPQYNKKTGISILIAGLLFYFVLKNAHHIL